MLAKCGLAFLITLLFLVSPAHAQAVLQFDLPSQPLAISLRALGSQSSTNVLFDPPLVEGRKAPALKAQITLDQAFSRVLAGSGLKHRFLDEKTVMVVAAAAANELKKPAARVEEPARMHLAQADEAREQASSGGSATPVGKEAEIVVTALRRTAKLQDVPASVTALSAESLRRRNANEYRDILAGQPSVSFFDIGYQRNKTFVRGVSNGIGSLTDATTGTYVDEVPVTEIRGQTLDIGTFDVDRIEILRGPQGTLFGAGSMGGTIRVITNRPKMDGIQGLIEGDTSSVQHGSGGFNVNGMVNLPIVTDSLAVRLVATHREDAGFIDNLALGDRNANTFDSDMVRGGLLWKPASATRILLSALYKDDEYGANGGEDLDTPRYTQNRYIRESGGSRTHLVSLNLEQDLSFATLVSTTSYISKKSYFVRDVTLVAGGDVEDLTGAPLVGGVAYTNTPHYEAFTQEVRLASTGSGPFSWIGGVFYQDLKPDYGSVFSYPADLSANIYTGYETFHRKQVAGFGELTYRIVPQVAVTAGVRVFNFKGGNTVDENGYYVGGDNSTSTSFRKTSAIQKYNVTWNVTPDNLLYTQASQGFRAGGPTSVSFSSCQAELGALGYDRAPTQYAPDTLWNYELGSKNTLYDRKLSINAAAYRTDWSEIQAQRNLECGLSFVGNLGKARISGVELELNAQPLAGLALGLAGSRTDTKVLTAIPSLGANAGDRLPLVAKWTGSVNAQYRFDLTPNLRAYVRGDAQYVGDRFNDFQGLDPELVVRMRPYTTLSLRAGVETTAWEAAVYVSNVTDSRGVVLANRDTFFYDVLVRPRTVGLNIKRYF